MCTLLTEKFIRDTECREKFPEAYNMLKNAVISEEVMSENGTLDNYCSLWLKPGDDTASKCGCISHFIERKVFILARVDLIEVDGEKNIQTNYFYIQDSKTLREEFTVEYDFFLWSGLATLKFRSTVTWMNPDGSCGFIEKETGIGNFTADSGNGIIEKCDIIKPRASNHTCTKVNYGRTGGDYSYKNIYKDTSGYFPVWIPFMGKISVDPGWNIVEILKGPSEIAPSPELTLLLSDGGVVKYCNDFVSQIKINGSMVEWELIEDWNNKVSGSALLVSSTVSIRCTFTIKLQNKIDPDYFYFAVININSQDSVVENNNQIYNYYVGIEPIQIGWGCVGEDSEITMADGSLKVISNIKPLEWVMLNDGTVTKILDIIKGREEHIIVIRTENGLSVKVTPDHPVKTQEGFVKAKDLNILDCIGTVSGYSDIKELYIDYEYNKEVYNLSLEKSGAYIANGIISGDFDMQNNIKTISDSPIIYKPEIIALRDEFNALYDYLS